MKRPSLAIGLALVVSGTAIPTRPVDAQFIKNPGQGAAIADLVLRRNFVTVVDDGSVTGRHPNEAVFARGAIEKVTADPRGQTVFVANEARDIRTKYLAGPGHTTFVLDGPSATEPLIEECLIFDIAGNTLSSRSTDANSSAYALNPVFVPSYSVGTDPDEVTVEILEGKIVATDNATGHERITDVLWLDGTPVPPETIADRARFSEVVLATTPFKDASEVHIPVGPGGSRTLRVVTDDPVTHAPSKKPREIVVVGSKIKEVVSHVQGSDQDDIFYVRAEAQWPELAIDGRGGFDTYIVDSPEPGEPTAVGMKIPAHYIQEVAARQHHITVVLADFEAFEQFEEADGSTRFVEPGTNRTQIIKFVDRDGNPVKPDGVAIFSSDEFDGS